MTLTSMHAVTEAAGQTAIRTHPTAYRTVQIDGVSIFYLDTAADRIAELVQEFLGALNTSFMRHG
jgi:hypothetical protein